MAETATLTTTFAGVSTLSISDGRDCLLFDGYFSRPGLETMMAGTSPDRGLIVEGLDRLGVDRASAVLVAHSHIDHSFDAPVVAELTGAVLAGSESTRMIQVGYGTAGPFQLLTPGEPVAFGAFTVTPFATPHSDGDAVPGEITEPLRLPAKLADYKTGESYSFHVEHSEGSVLVVASANRVGGTFAGLHADRVYLGAGAVGLHDDEWIAAYWDETVRTTGAKMVRLIHWDQFWLPLDQPLQPLPPEMDDLDHTLDVLGTLAARDGVDLSLPVLWEPEALQRPV